MMADTSIKKTSARTAPQGAMGQEYLVSGTRVALRRWSETPGGEFEPHARPYETVGYVISGLAELELEGQLVRLEPGDSWLVPANAEHQYRIYENFVAVEATSPPARVGQRDEPVAGNPK